jgi:Sulfotransferase family
MTHGSLTDPRTSSSEPWPEETELLRQLRGAREVGRRVPDFFIVGHAKCGTTAMHEMLSSHPQIYMPAMKETQFLARERQDARAFKRPTARPLTLEAYLSLFDGARLEQRVGEASTTYLRTPVAARRIAELRPDARIVAIFREPVSFLRSLHLQLLEVKIEDERDFARALDLEAERRQGRQIPRNCPWRRALQYSSHVNYASQMRQYHELFGRDRVLLLLYDDFRSDNERVLRQLLRFVGVDDALEINSVSANPTVRVRSHGAHELLTTLAVGNGPLSRAVSATVKGITPQRLRRKALDAAKQIVVDRQPPPADGQLTAELRTRFHGEVVAASEYLERDLVSLWGYDELPEPRR